MAILANLQEPFTGTAIPSGWTQTALGSASFTYDQTGATINLPATTSSSTDGDLNFTTTNDLTGSFARLAVLGVSGASATHTDNVLRLRINTANYLTIFYEAGTLFFSKVVAGSQTNIASVTYDPVAHAWWQLREKNGVTYWETSADGVKWNIQTQQANPIAVTTLDILIGALCFGVDTNPLPFKFRYFNYPQPGTTTSTSSISTTSSSISSTSASTTSASTSSTSSSTSTSSTSSSISSTSSSISSTSSSISSTSASSTSASTSTSSTSSSISSTSISSTSQSSTSASTSISSTSSSISSTSSSISSTSMSISSTSASSTSSSMSTSTTTIPIKFDFTYEDVPTLNLVGNPGFEYVPPFQAATTAGSNRWIDGTALGGKDPVGSQYGWGISSGGTNTPIQFDTSISHTGQASLKISTLATAQSPQVFNTLTSNAYFLSTYGIPLQIGKSYTLTGWIMTVLNSGAANTGAFIQVDQRDNVGGLITSSTIGRIVTTTPWTRYTAGFTPRPNATYFDVKIGIVGSDGLGTLIMDAWFDDITLTPTATLTGANNDAVNAMTPAQVADISVDDGDYFIQTGSEFMIQEYKYQYINNTDIPVFTWKGRTTVPTSRSPFFIQIFNNVTIQWETLLQETLQPADVDFTRRVLQATNLSNYYDANNVVSFRTLQQVI